MEYKEDDFLLISGIQHFAFCKRQWALIHIEHQWDDNEHTVIGELLHEKAHDPYITEKQKGIIVVRGMPIHSREIGISGECDVVEFHTAEDGVRIHGHRGSYELFPVEYKKGHAKKSDIDILQLMAEAMCLEEMFQTHCSEGALYYGETHHRTTVTFTENLREKVKQLFSEMHNYASRGYTPKIKQHKGCKLCSLRDICMPELEKATSVNKYISNAIVGQDE